MRNTLCYPDGERWDRQGFQLASEQPYCRQRPEPELSLAQQVEKEPVLPAPGAGSAGIAGAAGYWTLSYKFTYKGCHSRGFFPSFLLSLQRESIWANITLFFFFGNLNSPDGCYAPLLSYRKARLQLPSTWNKSGQICGSRAACRYRANAGGGLSCTAAVLLERGGEIWGCVCSCSVKPSELCWGWGGGRWLWGAELCFSGLQQEFKWMYSGEQPPWLIYALALNQKLYKQAINHGTGGTQKLLPATRQVMRRK